MNKRFIALLAIFAIALSSTGLASLATLQQNLQVSIIGTATTIDFQFDNTTTTLSVDFGLVERGNVRFVPIHLTNSEGTGYVSVSTSPVSAGGGTSPYFLTNTAAITTDSRMVTYFGIDPANCSVAGGVVPADWSTAGLVGAVPLFPGTGFTIAAGGSQNICAVIQVGGDPSLGPVPANGTAFDLQWTIRGFYP
jgi:hypothetical protein